MSKIFFKFKIFTNCLKPTYTNNKDSKYDVLDNKNAIKEPPI